MARLIKNFIKINVLEFKDQKFLLGKLLKAVFSENFNDHFVCI